MRRKYIFYLIITVVVCITILSCQKIRFGRKVVFPEEYIAYNKYGPVADYKIDEDKPKVINYICNGGDFDFVFKSGYADSIPFIIERNKDIEFILIVPTEEAWLPALYERLERYNITYPVIVDIGFEFEKLNRSLKGTSIISFFCNKDYYPLPYPTKQYYHTFFPQSGFEKTLAIMRSSMKANPK